MNQTPNKVSSTMGKKHQISRDAYPKDLPVEVIYLSSLLESEVVNEGDVEIGTIVDVIVRLRAKDYPVVTGIVINVDKDEIFVPIADIKSLSENKIILQNDLLVKYPFHPREGEVLLNADILGHRLIHIARASLVRAYDVGLIRQAKNWIAVGLVTRRQYWFNFAGILPKPTFSDWSNYEALIGHKHSGKVRSKFGRLRSLKPAQIADLIEEASEEEQGDLLEHLQNQPELEADVFEELDDEEQSRLLKSRSPSRIAEMLSHMNTDDAVDAFADLPQSLRKEVLDFVDKPKAMEILRLMRYSADTAGGLMSTDYFAVDEDLKVKEVLEILRHSKFDQPEVLTTIYMLDGEKRLTGSISLVGALQSDPRVVIGDIAEHTPAKASPSDDIVDIVNQMADYNLLNLPVVGEDGRILGSITVDDALEVTIPKHWRESRRYE